MEIHVFDLDKTLICADSYDLWHEFLYERGILGADFIAKNNEMIALYDEGKLDMMGYLAFSVEALSAMSIENVAQIMPDFLREKIAPIVRKKCEIWRNEIDFELEAEKFIDGKTKEAKVIPFWPAFLSKDFLYVSIFMIFFFYLVGFHYGFAMDPINFDPANSSKTPAHIYPEWYFFMAI